MKFKQLKNWIQSGPDKMPHCYLVAHAGGTGYLVEVEVKNQLEPLRDDKKEEVMQFESVEQVCKKLKKLGLKKATLRLLDPYDEFGPSHSVCKEDMVITL